MSDEGRMVMTYNGEDMIGDDGFGTAAHARAETPEGYDSWLERRIAKGGKFAALRARLLAAEAREVDCPKHGVSNGWRKISCTKCDLEEISRICDLERRALPVEIEKMLDKAVDARDAFAGVDGTDGVPHDHWSMLMENDADCSGKMHEAILSWYRARKEGAR